MFKKISIPAFLIILYSCSTETKKEETLPPKPMLSEIDSIATPNGIVYFTDTTQAAFTSLFKDVDTSEVNNIKANAKEVSRHGDSLKITIGKLGTRTYVTNMDDDLSEEFVSYKYVCKLNDINYHVLFVGYNESFTYLLVNAATGKETDVCSMPAVSPDKTKVATGFYDIVAGFVFNGLELFEVTKDSLKPLWGRELTKWGPGDLIWLDNNTLLGQKNYIDSSSNTLTSYIKLSNVK